ncbi:MAG: two-component system sensor histidine kinase CreC [Verrucomicrobiales bacterium]|nr:two-component system sensor histidine kinase CreC [Verrucomicrobiales bacterium]
MKITLLIVIGFLAIAGSGFYWVMKTIRDDVSRQYSQASEEPLVDFAHLFAGLLEQDLRDGKIDVSNFRQGIASAYKREFLATIYQLEKREIQTNIYITNEVGIVIFDSDEGKREGKDYSEYNDVYLARQGKYGVRSTRLDPGDPRTSVFFIAAPIYFEDEMIGTLTVSRPEVAMAPFVDESRRLILKTSLVAAAVVAIGSVLWAYLILSPIRNLTRHALGVAQGEKETVPPTGLGELKTLSLALEKMRRELEGRHYVENYVQALTHELKSPLAAIRGAAELVDESMPEETRKRFLNNILTETTRSEDMVRRLVQLASVESQTTLGRKEEINLSELLKEELEELKTSREARNLTVEQKGLEKSEKIVGDSLMLRIAIRNVLGNAFDFSPNGGTVEVELAREEGKISLWVRDEGPGIPDFAEGRVFDRFYSLKNEVTGRKGSGIGLSFVRSAMELHGGDATLTNRPDRGAVAKLTFA